MSTRINTNTTAFMASQNLNMNSDKLSMDIQRLSTGLRINSAADDPAGLVISENLAAQASGVTQATMNSNDAINEIKTAEGALNQVQSLLISMRQLAVHASNLGVNDTTDVQADQTQIASAISSIDRIASTTQFGTKKLLDGSATSAATTTAGSVTLTPASGSGASLVTQGRWNTNTAGASNVTVTNATFSTAVITDPTGTPPAASDGFQGNLTINGVSYAVGSSAKVAGTWQDNFTGLTGLNAAISSSGYVASITGGHLQFTSAASGAPASAQAVNATGLYHNAATGTIAGGGGATSTNEVAATAFGASAITAGTNSYATLSGLSLNSSSAVSSGTSTIFSFSNGFSFSTATPTAAATATTSGTIATIASVAGATTTGTSLQYQTGGNEGQTSAESIQSTASDQLGLGAASYTDANGVSQTVLTSSVKDLNVTTFKSAQDAIAVLDNAISQISTLRANLGAFQTNVLASNVTSLGVASTNLAASKSAITDTDLASQVTDYTKNQILVQAATSALSYANQMPQSVLKLLQ